MNGRDMAYKMLITFPDSTGPSAILKKRLFSPFVPIRSVETAVASDVWSLSVVGVEKEKNVGIQTRVHHNRDSGKSVENRAPGLGTPVNIVKINTIIIVPTTFTKTLIWSPASWTRWPWRGCWWWRTRWPQWGRGWWSSPWPGTCSSSRRYAEDWREWKFESLWSEFIFVEKYYHWDKSSGRDSPNCLFDPFPAFLRS